MLAWANWAKAYFHTGSLYDAKSLKSRHSASWHTFWKAIPWCKRRTQQVYWGKHQYMRKFWFCYHLNGEWNSSTNKSWLVTFRGIFVWNLSRRRNIYGMVLPRLFIGIKGLHWRLPKVLVCTLSFNSQSTVDCCNSSKQRFLMVSYSRKSIVPSHLLVLSLVQQFLGAIRDTLWMLAHT